MTTEQFDNYSFSIYTEVKVKDYDWLRITAVNFGFRQVETNHEPFISSDEILEIRN
jgi:hypothetical protein